MEKFFAEHLEFFAGARRLQSVKIFRHDPSLIISQTAVLVKYEVAAEMPNGTTQTFILRGSSDPSHNRRKSYYILVGLRKAGFDRGPYLVQKPLGYFENFHFLLYENFPGPSLMQDLERGAINCPGKIVKSVEWLAKFHQTDLPDLPRIYYDWKNEQGKFQKLKADLIKKFGDRDGRISKVIATLTKSEKNLLRPKDFILVHGDFQPNNILAVDGQTSVIDFNDAFLYDELFDLVYFKVQMLHMLKRLNRPGLEKNVENAVEYYLNLRNIKHDKLVKKKIALFTAKTLLRIKILTSHELGSVILKDIETYVQETI